MQAGVRGASPCGLAAFPAGVPLFFLLPGVSLVSRRATQLGPRLRRGLGADGELSSLVGSGWYLVGWGVLRRDEKGDDGLGGSSRVVFVRARQSMGCSRGAELGMIPHCLSPLVAYFRSFAAAPTRKERKSERVALNVDPCVLGRAKVWVNAPAKPRYRAAVGQGKGSEGDDEHAWWER